MLQNDLWFVEPFKCVTKIVTSEETILFWKDVCFSLVVLIGNSYHNSIYKFNIVIFTILQ